MTPLEGVFTFFTICRSYHAQALGTLVHGSDRRLYGLANHVLNALALEASPELLHEVMIITADTPLCRAEPSAFFDDPGSTLESLIPGINKAFSEHNIPIPHQGEWFTIKKAKKLLGYNPVHNFDLGLLQKG